MAPPSGASLLHAAELLLSPGPGQPTDAAVRRAVSTAYYALFSAVCDEVARPWGSEVHVAARRLLRHHAARDACSVLLHQQRVAWLKDRPACHADLLGFAACFVELLAAREDADYDGDYVATEGDAREAIAAARDGVEHLHRARTVAPEQVNAMCVAMIAGPAERRRMTR